MSKDQANIIDAIDFTPSQEAYDELGKELVKRSMPFVNDVLKQLITLSASLLGGGIVFIDDSKIKIMTRDFKILGLVCFIIALVIALW